MSSFSRQRVMMARMFGSGVIPGYLELGCFRWMLEFGERLQDWVGLLWE